MPQVAAYNNVVNPYGEGNVRLDSTPVVAYYMRQQAQKRATDEALDKWYMDMEKNVTPTGMRTIDIPLLIEGKKRAQEFWLQNKRAIKNPDLDGGKSLIEYSKLHNDNLGLVRGSQNEYAGGKQLAGILADPNKRSLMNERAFGLIDANSRPLGTEGFISSNDILNDNLFHAKPLTPAELLAKKKGYRYFAGDQDESRIVKGALPSDNTKDIVHVISKFSPEKLQRLGYAAEDDFNNDEHLQITYHEPTPDEYNRIREVGQKVYGEKWEPDTPAKVWAGLQIAENIGESIKEEHVINKQRSDAAAFARQKQLADRRAEKTQADLPTIRVYKEIEDLVNNNAVDVWVDRKGADGTTHKEYVAATPTNHLGRAAQERIVASARVRDPDVDPLSLGLRVREDGKIWVLNRDELPSTVKPGAKMVIPKEAWLVPLEEEDIDRGASETLGQGSERKAVEQSRGNKPPTNPSPKPTKRRPY